MGAGGDGVRRGDNIIVSNSLYSVWSYGEVVLRALWGGCPIRKQRFTRQTRQEWKSPLAGADSTVNPVEERTD